MPRSEFLTEHLPSCSVARRLGVNPQAEVCVPTGLDALPPLHTWSSGRCCSPEEDTDKKELGMLLWAPPGTHLVKIQV